MRLKWAKHYHVSGNLASVEASIVKTGFPGFTDVHTAVILPLDNGRAMAYVQIRDGQLSQSSLWADKTFKSIRAAQGWAKSILERW